MPNVSNTKPPLLFWQGIASTGWAKEWTLWRLRYPSVLYTVLAALVVMLAGWRLSGRIDVGLLAALSFLSFFTTYRYGRPFLTNPPEVFWLSLPLLALLCSRSAGFESRLVFPLLMGLATGIALLYKSFALAVPMALVIGAWHLHRRRYDVGMFLARDALKVALFALVACAIFGVWFVVDPNPRGVWNEFVIGENLTSKFGSAQSYLPKLMWGLSSLWSLALSYPVNAGLLALPVVALVVLAVRGRRQLSEVETRLWIWMGVFVLFYTLPSQRSGRYLLPAMPALALLLAFNFHRIGRRVLGASLLGILVVVGAMSYLAFRLCAVAGGHPYEPAHWLVLGVAGLVPLAGLLSPDGIGTSLHAAVFLAFLSFAVVVRPLDGPLGSYDAGAQDRVRGQEVWVPYDFMMGYEHYRFLLPGAHIHGYREDEGLTPSELAAKYPIVAVRVPLDASLDIGRILGGRIDLRGRQNPGEIRQILHGSIAPLMVREYLIDSRNDAPDHADGH
jgi:4-amino-4-deoxy-L-arabinose transferase-like glycosyltransferase